VHEIRLDCDEDVVLLKVEQIDRIACHTGRHSCFFQLFEPNGTGGGQWVAVDPVLKDPETFTK
jgi:phosphoribosyl-AMP cyclohydrolase